MDLINWYFYLTVLIYLFFVPLILPENDYPPRNRFPNFTPPHFVGFIWKLLTLKYELDKLDKFIEANLCIENLFGDCLYDVDLSSNILFIKQEKERIRLALMMEVCCIEDDKTAEKYIRNHQTGLVYLANKVIAYKEEAVPRVCGYLVKDYLSFSDEVQICLEFLLGFIEKYFSQYFDRDIAITECYQRLIESELNETLIRLEGLLYQGVDRTLYILLDPF